MNVRNNSGLTLIEALISVLVVSIGFIGLTNIQSNNLKTNQSAFYNSQAVVLGNFMLDALRANKAQAIAGDYNLGTLASPHCTVPSDTNLVTHDQHLWMSALKNQIANSASTCGVINCDTTTKICVVTVFWDDTRASGLANRSVEVASRL